MKRVMIIDDEMSTRGLLKKIISWEKLGLEVVGEAASGVEAINKIDDIQPHIALVDITMPFMNGIEFSKLALERYPRLKIIVLTAHEDFRYAKECISLGVSDYLLKPINRKEIEDTLERVSKKVVLNELAETELEGDTAISHDAIEKVKAYLVEEYQDSSINLTSVAQRFGFNPSYFSRRFRIEEKVSFVEYLTQYRMEKACELAREGEKMYITAEKTGIVDPNYFGRCFKKYKGVTYSEYQKQLKKGN